MMLALACSSPKRPFLLEDAERLRQLFHPVVSPDGKWIAYNVDDTLWVTSVDPGTTGDREPRMVATGMTVVNNVQNPFVAWSPDGHLLVFQSDTAAATSGSQMSPPVMAAEFDEAIGVRPLFPDSLANRVVPLHAANLGMLRGSALGGPAWSPDGTRLAFLAFPRTTDGLAPIQVHLFDLDSGVLEPATRDPSIKTGFAWSHDGRWLAVAGGGGEDQHWIRLLAAGDDAGMPVRPFEGSGPFYDLLWAPGEQLLLARSIGNGSIVLTVRNGALEHLTELTDRDYIAWTADGTRLVARVLDGMSPRIALVDLASDDVHMLTGPDTSVGSVTIADAARAPVIAFVAETGELAPDLWTATLDRSGLLTQRRRVTAANPWLDSVSLARSEVFRWASADGDTLEALLFVPREHSRAPRPLVVIPYGGFWNGFPGSDDLMTRGIEALASQGWAVVRPNTRGIASAPQSHGYGEVQLEDTHLLLDALAAAAIVDTTRVALFGHSHGATMVYYYLSHSGRFIGGIAFNGAADWVYQAGLQRMTGLPGAMGGLPEEVPDIYEAASPYANAAAVTVPLLAIAGGKDTQVPPHNARVMVDTLQALGRPAELLEFPEEDHWIRAPENQRIFWERVTQFLAAVRR